MSNSSSQNDSERYRARSSSLKKSPKRRRSRSLSNYRQRSSHKVEYRSPRSLSRSPYRNSRLNQSSYRDNPERFTPNRNDILAVFGLDRDATENDLYNLYKKYGCKQCKVIFDKRTGRPRGFGFVYFSSGEDASRAKHATNGKLLLTREIRVDYSIGERDYPSTRPSLNDRHSRYSNGLLSSGSYVSSDHYEKYLPRRDPREYARVRSPSPPSSSSFRHRSSNNGHHSSSYHRSHRQMSPHQQLIQHYTNDSRLNKQNFRRERSRSRSIERYRRESPMGRNGPIRHEYRR